MGSRTAAFVPFALLLCSVALLLPLAAGCGGRSPSRAETAAVEEAEPLYFEPLAVGTQASLADTTEQVIRDAATWEAFAPELTFRKAPPEIDFSQVMVLVAGFPAPSSGYVVEFEGVESGADGILAEYVISRPAQDCLTAPALTYPFQVVMVRRSEGEVRFAHRVEDLSCTLGGPFG